MYCSTCGTESAKGLKYCKSCGARIVTDSLDVQHSVAKTFAYAAVFAGAFGLIAFAVILKELLASGAKDSFVLLIAGLYLGSLIAIIYTITRQVLKLIGVSGGKPEEEVHSTSDAPAFSPAVTRQLDEFREPASVTDETTRNLEKVPAEHN
ncbi:MAG: zinc ribbon domain-containing protein [Acidobacteriota bacterium]|nr:MAG: zinc ribbon domain-containing protein [Acidobacteriota bacterium]